MPDTLILLFLSAVAVLALVEMGLGRPASAACGGGVERLGLREFATRPLPLFLAGLGWAMLPGQAAVGGALLLLSAGLGLLGPRAVRQEC